MLSDRCTCSRQVCGVEQRWFLTCLFREFNDKMISALDTELHKIVCIDEIDETSSSHKWTKKAQKQLEKLNNDSNLTS